MRNSGLCGDAVRVAFTVGYAEGYDGSLAESTPENPLMKVGQRDGYPGGWVWESPLAAASFLVSAGFAAAFPDRDPAEFAVYRLELPSGWEADVFADPGEDGVHHLCSDARIVERVA